MVGGSKAPGPFPTNAQLPQCPPQARAASPPLTCHGLSLCRASSRETGLCCLGHPQASASSAAQQRMDHVSQPP